MPRVAEKKGKGAGKDFEWGGFYVWPEFNIFLFSLNCKEQRSERQAQREHNRPLLVNSEIPATAVELSSSKKWEERQGSIHREGMGHLVKDPNSF